MLKINEYIVYKRDVCKITGVKERRGKKYYTLVPINDETLTIYVPFDKAPLLIREIISADEVERIISLIPSVKPLDSINEKMIEEEYKMLLNTGDYVDLIKIIKTSYLRNKKRTENNKHISEKDDSYFKMSEKLLYNEFAISLGMSYQDTKEYIIKKVNMDMDN